MSSSPEPYTVFGPRQRTILTILLGLASLTSPLTVNIYLPLLPLLQEQYRVSVQAINLTITLYVVIQAVMPIFFALMADSHGRRLISLANLFIYAAASAALTVNDFTGRSYPALLLLRALQSLGASACATTIYGIAGDVCIPANRGSMVAPVIAISNLGTVLGPVIGGLVAGRTGSSAWVFVAMAIFSAANVTLISTCLPETARSVVGNGGQKKRAALSGLRGWIVLGPRWSSQGKKTEASKSNETGQKTADAKRFSYPNPFESLKLFMWKDTATLLLLGSCSYAEWYTINATWPQIFKHNYGWSEFYIGLSYIPSAVGSITAGLVNSPWMKARYKKTAREANLPVDGHRVEGFPIEKARIRGQWFVFLGTHLGLVGLGWAVHYQAHPAIILVMRFFTALLQSTLFSSFGTLLTDVYVDRPSTAAAAASLTRGGLSGIGLAILQPLADAMGWAWFFTFTGLLVGLVQGICMLVMLKWGQKWRESRMSRTRSD